MNPATHTFTVAGMHCPGCGLLIDDTLEDLPGVLSSKTSRKARTSIVELDLDVITPAEVAEAIRSAGYRVS